ncbi:hypothetical protein GCM10023215_30770 [Pseudonocardia yuanmonensis]|uniref:Uncharacterized protein n=1 Tax=Pseudonocardia yuanmonensis TaxID=1095914 RepID=A0ABP8WNN1_9PSEU
MRGRRLLAHRRGRDAAGAALHVRGVSGAPIHGYASCTVISRAAHNATVDAASVLRAGLALADREPVPLRAG